MLTWDQATRLMGYVGPLALTIGIYLVKQLLDVLREIRTDMKAFLITQNKHDSIIGNNTKDISEQKDDLREVKDDVKANLAAIAETHAEIAVVKAIAVSADKEVSALRPKVHDLANAVTAIRLRQEKGP